MQVIKRVALLHNQPSQGIPFQKVPNLEYREVIFFMFKSQVIEFPSRKLYHFNLCYNYLDEAILNIIYLRSY